MSRHEHVAILKADVMERFRTNRGLQAEHRDTSKADPTTADLGLTENVDCG